MNIQVFRYNSANDHTNNIIKIDGEFECYGLEDEFREIKVMRETRIPDGTYPVTLRTVGTKHAKYLRKFGNKFHKGMLWIRDIPNFKYVLIHIGNTDEDTAGCLLVGDTQSKGNNFIGNSTVAYKRMYTKVRDTLLNGECVDIEFITI